MATHSSVLAWKIPGMGEPGGLPSLGSHRVRQDWCDLAAAATTTFHHPPEGSQPEITFTEQIYDNTWNCALATYLGKRWQGLGRCIRCTANLEHWAYQAPGHLSGLDPVKVKTTQPVWICSLWSIGDPEHIDMGSACNAGLTWDSSFAEPAGACTVWTHEVHATLGWGKPSVVHPPWALPTQASSICLYCPSLPTAQLNKWG